MLSAEIDAICDDLYTKYKADPYELFLTPASRVELNKDLLDTDVKGYPLYTTLPPWPEQTNQFVAGVVVEQYINRITGSVIDIRDSDQPYDTMVVELHMIPPHG